MMIEGGARWGFDPIWESDEIPSEPYVDHATVMNQINDSKQEKRRQILLSYLQAEIRRTNYLAH